MIRKLCLIVGHSIDAKGAPAVGPINSTEYDYNCEVAAAAYRYAREMGLDARIFLRNGVGIEGCYLEVNSWAKDADLVCAIELHLNAFNGKTRGTETLWDKEPADNVEFAREVQQAVCSVFKREGKANRGLKLLEPGDRGHRNMSACEITGVLCEPFFCDNPDDAKLGASNKFAYALALVNATIKFMKAKEAQIERETNPGLN
jgi:N-acetylmuramoyl-L-alanine amidase